MLSSLFSLKANPKSSVKSNLLHLIHVITIVDANQNQSKIINMRCSTSTARVMFQLNIINSYSDIIYIKNLLGSVDFNRLIIAMNKIYDLIGKNLLDIKDIKQELKTNYL